MPPEADVRRNAARHSTAHYVLDALNETGIDYLFCNFGTDHAPIIEEIARWTRDGRRLPKIVVAAHENVAVHMAGGYALMTGRGQGVLVHVDAGTANAAMAMHNLFRNRLPVLLMAGTAPFTSFGELTGSRDTYVHFIQQPMDQASLVRPYAKWEYTLPAGITAKETLRRAHTVMQSEPKGPVYLMLPREILTQQWDEDAVRAFPAAQFGPAEAAGADPEIVDRLADRLVAARNPLLITAYAGRDPAASAAIQQLAELAGIRVVDFLSVANIGREFSCFGGYLPETLAATDVGLLVDVDVPWLPVSMRDDPGTFWAQIDIDVLKAASPMWSFPANLRLQGRSSRILAQLLAAVEARATPPFRAAAAERKAALTAERAERSRRAARLAADKGTAGEINLHYLCAELGKAIGPRDIVLNEAVTKQAVLNMQIPRPEPCTMISNGGGGLGASGGMALGVKLACPDRTVVQVVGDGTFYFNNPPAVLATAKQYGLPILTIVVDNTGWGAVKGSVLRVYPEGEAKAQDLFQSGLAAGTDFSKMAEGFGAYGEKLTDPAQVPAAIARCLEAVRQGQSALLHATVTKL
ncbi:MAG TPA: thiamine pyrophosphate-requiring protein [Stellaceae bacterium]|nr:thiamine pyrophosphate-requiring protein [Stellaceae bacterium]